MKRIIYHYWQQLRIQKHLNNENMNMIRASKMNRNQNLEMALYRERRERGKQTPPNIFLKNSR